MKVSWTIVGNIIGALCFWLGLSILADLAPPGWRHGLARIAVAAIMGWYVGSCIRARVEDK